MNAQPKETPMPFAIRNLSVLAYAQGFTLWLYKGPGPLAETSAEGFFAPCADMFNLGDMILISASDGGRLVCVRVNQPHVEVAPLS